MLAGSERHGRARQAPARSREGPPPDDPGGLSVGLTGREQQVLTLLAQGRNNATIGQELFLSSSTVKHHVARILGKLGATSRAQAARFGLL